MHALDLDVKQAVRISAYTGFFIDVPGEVFLVDALDLCEVFQELLIVQIGFNTFDPVEISEPAVADVL